MEASGRRGVWVLLRRAWMGGDRDVQNSGLSEPGEILLVLRTPKASERACREDE